MKSPLNYARLLACIILALPTAISGQVMPAQNPSLPASSAPEVSAQGQGGSAIAPNLFLYEAFMEVLGKEDDRIREATREGKSQIAPRHDYAADIGISSTEEKILLDIFLNEYRREKDAENRQAVDKDNHLSDLVQQSGREAALQTNREEHVAALKQRLAGLAEMRISLKNALGSESFSKIDRFVSHHLWGDAETGDRIKSDFVGRLDESELGQVRIPAGRSHIICAGAYRNYFDQVGRIDERNQEAAAGGKATEELMLPYGPPKTDRERDAFPIIIDAYRKINDNQRRFDEAVQQYPIEHRGDDVPYPLPPEIQSINQNFSAIIDETIRQLEQLLGDELFKQFDAPLYRQCPPVPRKGAVQP